MTFKKTLFVLTLALSIAVPVGVSGQIDRSVVGRDHTLTPIQHLVVIFQENVSFDHYFGSYPNSANDGTGPIFRAKPNTPLVSGLFPSGLLAKNPNSTVPFRLSRADAVTCDQDHGYQDEQKAFDGGAMDKFPETVGVGNSTCNDTGKGKGLVMGYYDGNTVTALWNYAQNFAMSDYSFNTTFGPSTPGALNLISGQTWGGVLVRGTPGGNVTAVDPATGFSTVIGDPRPAGDDCDPPTATTVSMHGRNVGDLLNQEHITWGWFQGGFRPTTAATGNSPAACGSSHANIAGSSSTDYIPHHEPFQYFAQTANPHHLPPSRRELIGSSDQANHQYDLEDFWVAAESGHLPAVSFLKASAYQDGHASYSDPLDEQTFLVETINHLMQLPEWDHMAIMIAYDDSDGWYDHVIGPIVHQSNTPDDSLFGNSNCGKAPIGTFQGRCGFGPRLPLMVISPWAKSNFVDHNISDQSSILRFIEDNWRLGRLGNQSTDAEAGPMFTMFDFDPSHPRTPTLVLNPSTGDIE